MTQLQRKELDKLRTKARKMELDDESGKFQFCVRGPPGNQRVAKIDKETRLEVDQ